MYSFQKSCPEASRQLSTIATGTGVVILVYGVYSLGRIFVAGALYGSLGAITGLLIPAPPHENENSTTTIDWCFDCMEHTSIFLVRKSVSMLREGFKNALSGMANESASVIQPWCQFYKSFSPKHNRTIEATEKAASVIVSPDESEKTPSNLPVNQKQQAADLNDCSFYEVYIQIP